MRNRELLGLTLALMVLISGGVLAQPPMPMTETKPPPDERNLAYGEHERHVLDLWRAPGEGPRPLVIFFHGGGFRQGDKWNMPRELLDACLEAGISVASANYRLAPESHFPAAMEDGARVVQFLRHKAEELGLDPARFCAVGNSAGAGISLWVAFQDDLAQPDSADPVARESTRLSCVAVYGGQSSYDPRYVRKLVGGRAHEHPALANFYGITLEELDTPRAYAMYEAASPVNYVSADDPPVFGFYVEPKGEPAPAPHDGPELYYPEFGKELEGYDPPGALIHHPRFGEDLKRALGAHGIEVVLRHAEDYPDAEDPNKAVVPEMVAFLRKHLGE